MNLLNNKKVYLGGDLLSAPMVDYRVKQRDQLNGIIGIEAYSPSDDESINDKTKATQEGLAERILKNDYNAMMNCDAFTFDVLNHATGTISELSILLGMKRQAQITIDRLEEYSEIVKYDFNGDITDEYENLLDEIKECQKIINKPVYVYSTDIREGNGHIYPDPYRTEVSFNQFLFGVILELTNGEGFISWEEVLNRLEKLGK